MEITDLNTRYLETGDLYLEKFGRAYAWLDTRTHEPLIPAANFVQTVEDRQGLKIAYPEEIAWRAVWITDHELGRQATELAKSGYGEYLSMLLKAGR